MELLFKEEQKFKQTWLWLLLIGGFLFSIVVILFQKDSFSDSNFYSVLFFNIGINAFVLLLLYSLKLKTEINKEQIAIQFMPFRNKKVEWSQVASFQIIDYGFVGGWGIRFWTKYGTVYNVSGSKGLHIKLKNGKQFLIGSQKTEELEMALKEVEVDT